ncbi:DedA family protein [Lacisediminihabitans profunda]|uniref:DedA family protein n=1 Tax=Lacisediminihabitans profunda TaxID=2594790 RepID=A0A5C8UYL0_9MICO|nr:DedA family protein [Lacisediminihabitans profunda]TXN32836.1 DedA family protein [Lacisediminihabitans profunda]
MNEVLGWILDTVRQVDPVLRVLLATVGMFLETSILIGLIVPGDTIVLVASTAIVDWAEWAALFAAVVVGSLAGESLGFALGRYFGPRIRVSPLGRRLGEVNWVRAKNYVDRRGGVAVFVSRFLPVLHALIPLTVGMSAMRYRKFLAWTAPACVIWAGAYVSVGWLAAGSYRQLSSQLHYAGYLFAAIIAVFLLLALLAKKLIVRSEARHMDVPPGDLPNDDGGTREP